MTQGGTSEKARSLLTLGRSCKPSLLRSRFRMQQAVVHGLRRLAILTVAEVIMVKLRREGLPH